MAEPIRYWTLEEAQTALPEAIALLSQVQASMRELNAERRRSAPAGRPASSVNGPSVNGHGSSGSALDLERRVRGLLERVERAGIQIKDLETGLIDFPYLRDGETVLLCYRLGEPAIAYWHDLQNGFAGRRPIDEL